MINSSKFFAILCILDVLGLGGIIIRPNDVLEKLIHLKMYTREYPSGIWIKDNIDLVSPPLPIKIIIHGFIESPGKEWVGKMTKALLRKYDCTVIIVDYTLLAFTEYLMAIQLGKLVGMHVGKFIMKLYNKASVPLQQFHVIGHSMGSHVAGFVGKAVIKLSGQQIWKITSLDAAGPIFRYFRDDKSQRLSSTDAEIVENLHTDDGRLGYEYPIGTIDIYANRGVRPQPGCYTRYKRHKSRTQRGVADALAELFICSHIKSHVYYIRALNGKHIPMTKCDSYEFFKDGLCALNEVVNLTEDVSKEVNGLFFFDTNN